MEGGCTAVEREHRSGAQKFGDAVVDLLAYLEREEKKAKKKPE